MVHTKAHTMTAATPFLHLKNGLYCARFHVLHHLISGKQISTDDLFSLEQGLLSIDLELNLLLKQAHAQETASTESPLLTKSADDPVPN